jgi:hypothetical protein
LVAVEGSQVRETIRLENGGSQFGQSVGIDGFRGWFRHGVDVLFL